MPAKQLALEKGGPLRLEVEWQGNFKDFEVRLDGALLGSFADKKALSEGQVFTLQDGSRLEVKLQTTALLPELSLTRDGAPLPGSDADPEQRVTAAANMIFFVAGLNALLGLVAAAFDVEVLKALGLGLGSLVVGAIYGALGYLVKEKRSSIALGSGRGPVHPRRPLDALLPGTGAHASHRGPGGAGLLPDSDGPGLPRPARARRRAGASPRSAAALPAPDGPARGQPFPDRPSPDRGGRGTGPHLHRRRRAPAARALAGPQRGYHEDRRFRPAGGDPDPNRRRRGLVGPAVRGPPVRDHGVRTDGLGFGRVHARRGLCGHPVRGRASHASRSPVELASALRRAWSARPTIPPGKRCGCSRPRS